MITIQHFTRHTKKLLAEHKTEGLIELAVECFDTLGELRLAQAKIAEVTQLPAALIKTRMIAHAQTAGYDNSEELANAL